MKVKNIRLTIKDRSAVFNEFANVLAGARKGENVTAKEEISFQNIDALRKVLTEKRMEILHVIKHNNPGSIYELAKTVNRDLKNVNTDIQILADLGLISLEEIQEERKKIRPFVKFDKLKVEIAI